jgi:hypothetical protein
MSLSHQEGVVPERADRGGRQFPEWVPAPAADGTGFGCHG